MNTSKRTLVAIAAYSVVAVFFFAYFIIARQSLLPSTLELLFATLIALPLALALTWDRLTSVKVTNILEINLKEYTAQPDTQLSFQLEGTDPNVLTIDGIKDILQNIKAAISEGITKELIEVNLGGGKSWLITRLYLLAALAENYTETKLIVFKEGNEHFVGMASPQNIRIALGTRFPSHAKAYRQARNEALSGDPPKGSEGGSDEATIVSQNYATKIGQLSVDGSIRELVTKQLLQECLRDALIVPIVKYEKEEYEAKPPSLMLLYDIMSNPAPCVALVDTLKPNLVTIFVNRHKLAHQVGLAYLRKQLKPSK